jgi:tight junction protein 1
VNGSDLPIPAYERVVLRKPAFKRPIVLFGPLADVARQLLLSNFALYFDTIDENVILMSSLNNIIDSNKHAILNVSPCSVERLVLSQYAPIVILLELEVGILYG